MSTFRVFWVSLLLQSAYSNAIPATKSSYPLDTRSIGALDNQEENLDLEVRQGPGQGQQTQPQMPQSSMQMPQQNMQMPPQNMQMPPQNMPPQNMPPQNMQMPPQNMPPQNMPPNGQMPQIQPQMNTMGPQPMVSGPTQMHPPDGQYHGPDGQFHGQSLGPQGPNPMQFGQPPYPGQQNYPSPQGYPAPQGYPGPQGYQQQPPMGYPAPLFNPTMGYPLTPSFNTPMPYPAAIGWPGSVPGADLPSSGYPPMGQMQLPVPPNQFASYGPSTPYTNPIYGSTLNSKQNSLEAQIASNFLTTQMADMLNNPQDRESLIFFLSELRSFLSNPNSIPLMKALNSRAQDFMNSPAHFQQQLPGNVPQSTSTIVQVQPSGPANLLEKFKGKGGEVVAFIKNVADANNRLLDATTGDIPLVSTIGNIGKGLTTAGVNILDGIMSPFLQPHGNPAGTTTVTTVSSPQTMGSFPNTYYQTPAITAG